MTTTKRGAKLAAIKMDRRRHSLTTIAELATSRRGCCVTMLLLIELLLAQLAIASPQLHDWMHGADDCHQHEEHSSESSNDSQTSEDHICTISLISEGLFQETNSSEISISLLVTDQACEPTFLPNGPAIVRHSARSPPLS